MLAYWLEDNGYVRGSLIDKHMNILTSDESKQEYIKSLHSTECLYHKCIIKNLDKNY